ncbi:transposase, partial [Azospirillum sp. sgz301742]
MAQHYLLSARSRGLGIASILALTEAQAHTEYCRIRWPDTGGQPVCPWCGCTACWICGAERFRFRCKRCLKDFTATRGTPFAKHKLSHRMLLAVLHTFLCGVSGKAALEMSRVLDVAYKTAFVLCHKLRVAMGSEEQAGGLGGPGWEVEVDGRYSGGYIKPANWRVNRRDRRLARNQNGKRRVTVVIRARNGQCRTWAFRTEEGAVDFIIGKVLPGTVVYADDAPSW